MMPPLAQEGQGRWGLLLVAMGGALRSKDM